jgi:uncharacterized protein (DUF2252 family)
MSTERPELPDPAVAQLRGRGHRDGHTRTSLAILAPRPASFDLVTELAAQENDRLGELLPLKHARMAADPLSFLRGGAGLQAQDLARSPSSGLEVQLCGDAHLMNFGVFSSPERRLVFDVNDFDETAVGPFEWDVKRLATSLAVAIEVLNLGDSQEESVTRLAVQTYRKSVAEFASQRTLQVWNAALDLDETFSDLGDFVSRGTVSEVGEMLGHVHAAPADRAMAKLIDTSGNRPGIANNPPLLVPLSKLPGAVDPEHLHELVHTVVAEYASSLPPEIADLVSQFTPFDAGRKVVGVGSVGTRCYVVLLFGRDGSDPFFLQVKEAGASVIDQALGQTNAFGHGERVVRGQRLMQATPDEFLGFHNLTWADNEPRSFYVRQLYDDKATIAIAQLDVARLRAYAVACAWTLARAHSRGGRANELAGYLGTSSKFDDAIVSFAHDYRHVNAADHAALVDAIRLGRVTST